MTRITRLSQTDLEQETNVKDALGFCRPSTDEFLLRDDLSRNVEKKILGALETYFLKGMNCPFVDSGHQSVQSQKLCARCTIRTTDRKQQGNF